MEHPYPDLFGRYSHPIGLLFIPGLLHDYGYKYNLLWQFWPDGHAIEYEKEAGKDFWDILFKNVGKDVNGFFLINAIVWLAVALGGSGAWDGTGLRVWKRRSLI